MSGWVALTPPSPLHLQMSLVTTLPSSKIPRVTPRGMVRIPFAEKFNFRSSTLAVENEDSVGGGERYPWEDVPHR